MGLLYNYMKEYQRLYDILIEGKTSGEQRGRANLGRIPQTPGRSAPTPTSQEPAVDHDPKVTKDLVLGSQILRRLHREQDPRLQKLLKAAYAKLQARKEVSKEVSEEGSACAPSDRPRRMGKQAALNIKRGSGIGRLILKGARKLKGKTPLKSKKGLATEGSLSADLRYAPQHTVSRSRYSQAQLAKAHGDKATARRLGKKIAKAVAKELQENPDLQRQAQVYYQGVGNDPRRAEANKQTQRFTRGTTVSARRGK